MSTRILLTIEQIEARRSATLKAVRYNKGKSHWAHLRAYALRHGPRNWQAVWANGDMITADRKTMDQAYLFVARATVAFDDDVYMDAKTRSWKPRHKILT